MTFIKTVLTSLVVLRKAKMLSNNIVAQFVAPYKINLIEAPLLSAQSDYVCVKYLFCGICGGDYSVYCGRRNNYPISLGHEFVGVVLSVGDSVQGIQSGQLVVSDFNYRCNECSFCKTKRSHLCNKNDIGLFTNRGFATYANIHSSYLLPIKTPAYLPRACLIEPLSCVLHACECVKVQKEMKVLICGGGGIGMLFCFVLSRIFENIDITVSEIIPDRINLLTTSFNIKQYNDNSRQSYDLIIDCSNSISGLRFSLDNAQRGANICIMSHLYGLDTSFVYEQACKKELNCLFPLRNGEKDNLIEATRLISQYWTNDDDAMLGIYSDIHTAFAQRASSPFCKHIVDLSSSLGLM